MTIWHNPESFLCYHVSNRLKGFMERCYCFPDSETGLKLMLNRTLSLRRGGFKTRAHTEIVCHFLIHVLTAIPASKPSRKERKIFYKNPESFFEAQESNNL